MSNATLSQPPQTNASLSVITLQKLALGFLGVQFVWIGVMCLFIYLTPFVVSTIYDLPDMSQTSYKKEEALYQVAQAIDAHVATETDYKTLSNTVTAISTQRKKLIVPTIADITSLNIQLDAALVPYLGRTMKQAVATIQQLAVDKTLSTGISKTERVIELKLALLEFPLYEKTLDTQTEGAIPEAEQALGNFATLPLLETLDKQEFYADTNTEARSTAMLAFMVFGLVGLLLTIPLALLGKKWRKKRMLTVTLACMGLSFGVASWVHSAMGVFYMLVGAGVAWATILSIPFALLKNPMTKDDERVMLRFLNLFICTPQFLAILVIGQWIEHSPIQAAFGGIHDWSLAFVVESAAVLLGMLVLQAVPEKQSA